MFVVVMCKKDKIKVDILINVQNILSVIFSISGIVLIFLGFFSVPIGEISTSLEIVLGELLGFIASLLGIDSYYSYRLSRIINKEDNKNKPPLRGGEP